MPTRPRITIVVHGYNNQATVDRQVRVWKSYPEHLKEQIEIIFVDDGSSPPLVLPALDLDISHLRILEDIPWNQPGAKNLGASLANADLLLFHDMDHFLGPESLSSLVAILDKLDRRTLYRFSRFRLDQGRPINPHLNSHILDKGAYWEIGGYDEDFAGSYACEDGFFEHCWRWSGRKVAVLENVTLQVDAGLATPGLVRDKSKNSRLARQKRRGKRLLFRLACRLGLGGVLRKHGVLPPESKNTGVIRFKWERV